MECKELDFHDLCQNHTITILTISGEINMLEITVVVSLSINPKAANILNYVYKFRIGKEILWLELFDTELFELNYIQWKYVLVSSVTQPQE